MKFFLFLLAALAFDAVGSAAQALTINPNAIFVTRNNINIAINNEDITNNSSKSDFTFCNLHMTGNQVTFIAGNGNNIFNNLYIDKGTGKVLLKTDVSVNTRIVMQSGDIDLGGKNIILAPTALLSGETNSRRIIGPGGGEIQITVNMNAPVSKNPGNLGAFITSSANLGSVTVARGHKVQTNNGAGKSIRRYYVITPTNNSSLNATLNFTYFDAEKNALNEDSFALWRSDDSGISWVRKGYKERSADSNYVKLSGIRTFATRFTLSTSGFASAKSALDVFNGETGKDNPEFPDMFDLQLMPNPVTNSQANIRIIAGHAVNADLMIVSSDGKIIMKTTLNLHAGLNNLPLKSTDFASGFYELVLKTKEGAEKSLNFVKQQ